MAIRPCAGGEGCTHSAWGHNAPLRIEDRRATRPVSSKPAFHAGHAPANQKRYCPIMAGYKDPTFEDRAALAQKAREKALKKLANKPVVDEETMAKRKAAQEAREAEAAEKSAAKRAAREQAKAEKAAAAKAAAEAAAVPEPTEAELKAARDAKYAARKARKKR